MRDTAPGSRGFDSKGEPDGAETSGSRSTPLHAARTSIYPTCGATRSAPGLHHSRTQVGDRSGVRRIWLKMFDVGWPFVTQGRPSMRWRWGGVRGSSGLRAHGRAWLSHGWRRLIYKFVVDRFVPGFLLGCPRPQTGGSIISMGTSAPYHSFNRAAS